MQEFYQTIIKLKATVWHINKEVRINPNNQDILQLKLSTTNDKCKQTDCNKTFEILLVYAFAQHKITG